MIKVYSRKISSEESYDGYILVLKSALSFFPSIGKSFHLKKAGLLKELTVETYRCRCRGPDKPHEHYFIPWSGLRTGDKVEITRDPKREGGYLLQIRR